MADTKLRMPCDGISRRIAASGLLKGIRGNSGSLGTVDRALVDFLSCICVRDDGIRRVLSYGHPLHSSSRGQPDPVPVARNDHCTWHAFRVLPPQGPLHRGHCAGLCWGSRHRPRRHAHTLLYGNRLALLAGLSWALYCLFRLKWHETSAALLVRGFGLAAFTCGVLHLLLESTVIPSIGSAAATVAVGIVPGALANWMWDHGFRRGNSQQLTVLAYTSPLCSALLLVVLGLESVTPTLVIGAGLIVMAALLSRTPS
jgi:uncharacterized membrane protein